MEVDAELAKAVNAFQAELVTVGKTANNPFFKSKYAPLDEIMKAAQPVLTKHGLAVVQFPSHLDGAPALTTAILHISGHSMQSTTPLTLAKDDPQGQGSAITYMRRYAYAAALGIVIDEDDDGNRASQPYVVSKTTPPRKPSVGTKNEPATPIQKKRIQAHLQGLGMATAGSQVRYLEDVFGVIPGSQMLQADAENILQELAS